MTRARTLADMISDGVIGTTELADDVITPVKLDETGSYQMAQLGIGTSSPSGPFHVVDGRDELSFTNASNNVYLSLTAGYNTKNSIINFYNTSDAGYGRIDYDHATEYMAFSTNSAERFRVDASGNFGIGTSSPNDTLHVYSASGLDHINIDGPAGVNRNVQFSAAGTARWNIYANSTSEGGSNAGSDLSVARYADDGSYIGGAVLIERSSGNVGIGTSAPSAMLDVAGDAEFESGKIIINEVTGADAYSEIRKTNGGSNFAISSPESIYMLIDSNNDQTNRSFNVGNNSTGPAGSSTLFTVQESGNVGIGTTSPSAPLDIVTSDTSVLEINSTAQGAQIEFDSSSTTNPWYAGIASNSGGDFLIYQNAAAGAGAFTLYTNGNERMRVTSGGQVGIGTSNPTSKLSLDAGSATGTHLDITTTGSGHNFDMVDSGGTARIRNVAGILRIGADHNNEAADSAVTFLVDGTEKMRITSDGYVGIGTVSPNNLFHCVSDDTSDTTPFIFATPSNTYTTVYASSSSTYNHPQVAHLDLVNPQNTTNGTIGGSLMLRATTGNGTGVWHTINVVGGNAGGHGSTLVFTRKTGSSSYAESMRINQDGAVGIGTVNNVVTSSSDTGLWFHENNYLAIARGSGSPLYANRIGNDGDVIAIRRDGVSNAAFGINGVVAYWKNHQASSDTGVGIAGAGQFVAVNSSGSGLDNSRDLGAASIRWDDVYATNSAIQTSDENEKQQIASLTDAEITAAKAISKLFKTFKWNNSVTEKGDAARTHTGVIAQQVETAMTDAGLSAGDYAFFISSTWWETQTDVPAVEADEENGVEAQEAYTRTDTYDTAEEAPEGATERNRKGIRYPELLSFVAAATEQRLASIETRLDALEAN